MQLLRYGDGNRGDGDKDSEAPVSEKTELQKYRFSTSKANQLESYVIINYWLHCIKKDLPLAMPSTVCIPGDKDLTPLATFQEDLIKHFWVWALVSFTGGEKLAGYG